MPMLNYVHLGDICCHVALFSAQVANMKGSMVEKMGRKEGP